ncbi:hypothetical protein SDC9_207786 [bioreactor metagenome]|uniref:Uncharacterized protein n=1 Tax=bioreactor metagenome TaxID=1076179 RepID=A0A645JKA2_9ZZZZ
MCFNTTPLPADANRSVRIDERMGIIHCTRVGAPDDTVSDGHTASQTFFDAHTGIHVIRFVLL